MIKKATNISKMKKILKEIDQKLSNNYLRAGRPLLPITKFIRKPMRWYYHQSPLLRHDSKIYLKPFLLQRLHSLFVVDYPKDFTIYKNQIKFRSFGSIMSEQAYYTGEVEHHLVQYLIKQICPNFVMIDVGGHHGAYTLIVAYELKKRGWNGVIHCFEPDINNFALLEYNIKQNELEEYVILYNQAVSNVTGKQDFCLLNDNSGNYLLSESNLFNNHKQKDISIQQVDVMQLDDLISKLDPVNLIKFDIQGGESLALKGAEKIIKQNRPILLVEAVQQWQSTKETEKILNQYQYLIQGVDKHGQLCHFNSPQVYVSWDWVALPQ